MRVDETSSAAYSNRSISQPKVFSTSSRLFLMSRAPFRAPATSVAEARMRPGYFQLPKEASMSPPIRKSMRLFG